MPVKPIPEGFHTLTPYFLVKDSPKFIDFLKKSFDAKEVYRSDRPDGTVMHAELKIGDSMVMLAEATEQNPRTSVMLYVYVEDVDEVYKRAVEASGVPLREPKDEYYGDRSGGIKDGFGNQWWMSTHVEDVSPEEMQRRLEELKKKKE